MTKHKDDVPDVPEQDAPDQQDAPGGQDAGQDAERTVVNQGEVSDPGNSGVVGTRGQVSGSADKPNG